MKKDTSKKFLKRMGELSQALKRVGETAGMSRADFIKLVDRIARKKNIRRWCDTESPVDYLNLIEAVKAEIAAHPDMANKEGCGYADSLSRDYVPLKFPKPLGQLCDDKNCKINCGRKS